VSVEDTTPMRPSDGGAALQRSSHLPRLDLRIVREYGIVAAFALLFITLSLSSSTFLHSGNLLNILEQNAPVGLVAVGGTLVFVAGGFDLSAGAIVVFAGVVAALAADSLGVWPALLAGTLSALALGTMNGLLTTVGRINAFIATLSTSIILGGAAVAMTGAKLVTPSSAAFSDLGQGHLGHIPYSVILWAVVAVALGLILSRSVFGRYVKAAGSSADAARLAGVPVAAVRTACYAASGFCAGLAGAIVASRIGSAQSTGGDYSLVFLAIAGIIVGGTSINGGEGAVWRSVLGILLLAMIGNGFNLMSVDPTYQDIIRGSIIIGAVATDTWSKRSRG
jgi:ribose transport system permease protein